MLDYSQSLALLNKLNKELQKKNTTCELYVIDDFAFNYWCNDNNLKTINFYSISTYSKIDSECKKLIEEISQKEKSDINWLNDTYYNMSNGADDLIPLANWKNVDLGFSNIKIKILDKETLVLFYLRLIDSKVRKNKNIILKYEELKKLAITLYLLKEYNINHIKDPWLRERVIYFTPAIIYLQTHDFNRLLKNNN